MIIGLAQSAMSTVASFVLRLALEPGWFRDVAIVAFWFAALGAGTLFLVKRFTGQGHHAPETDGLAEGIPALSVQELTKQLDEMDNDKARLSFDLDEAYKNLDETKAQLTKALAELYTREPGPSTNTGPFNPGKGLRSEVTGADFTGLWADDPFIECDLVVWNYTGMIVTIDRLEGSVSVHHQVCNQPHSIRTSVSIGNELGSSGRLKLRQPVTQKMCERMLVEYLAGEEGLLVMSFEPLTVFGTAKYWRSTGHSYTEGPVRPLANATLDLGRIIVRGPIQTEKQASALAKWEAIVASQEFYDSQGRVRS